MNINSNRKLSARSCPSENNLCKHFMYFWKPYNQLLVCIKRNVSISLSKWYYEIQSNTMNIRKLTIINDASSDKWERFTKHSERRHSKNRECGRRFLKKPTKINRGREVVKVISAFALWKKCVIFQTKNNFFSDNLLDSC